MKKERYIMAEELKTRSFRIEDSTAEQFKAISQEIGGNQQHALAKLIECYELQQGKAKLQDKREIIETFENHVTRLTNIFMQSLEENENMKENVRAEFESLLKSKDNTIIALQEQNKELGQYKDNYKSLEQNFNQKVAECESYKSSIAEKNNSIAIFNESYVSLKKELNQLKEDREHIEDLKSQCKQLEEQKHALESEIEHIKLEHDRALLEQEKRFNEQLKEIQDKYYNSLEEKITKTAAKKSTTRKKAEPKQEDVKEPSK